MTGDGSALATAPAGGEVLDLGVPAGDGFGLPADVGALDAGRRGPGAPAPFARARPPMHAYHRVVLRPGVRQAARRASSSAAPTLSVAAPRRPRCSRARPGRHHERGAAEGGSTSVGRPVPEGADRPGGATPRPASDPGVVVDVLVVDDDDGVRSTVAEILRRARHTVAEAENGEVALARLDRLAVGVLVVDVRMPRLDGLGLLRALDDPPPTIVISAYSVDDDTRRSLGGKVSAYLRKPFRPEHLLAAVASALGDAGA